MRLRLVVENEQQIVTMTGEVVRHGQDPDGAILFAVQFHDLDAVTVDFLQTLVTELGLARGGPIQAQATPG